MFELFEVESGQRFEYLCPLFGEVQPDHPAIVTVAGTGHDRGAAGPVYQLDACDGYRPGARVGSNGAPGPAT
jgi:hypothetical protein